MSGRWSLLVAAMLALGATGVLSGARTRIAPVRAQQGTPSAVDLNGAWLFSEKKFTNAPVQINAPAGGGAGAISAQFNGSGDCPGGAGTLDALFSGSVDASGAITGDEFHECSTASQFNMDCDLTDPFVVDLFQAQISADGNSITGQAFDPGYSADTENGHYINCRLSSDYDGWDDFTLMRAPNQGQPPPSQSSGGAPGTPSNAACTPSITSVTPIAPKQNQTITISGNCFGSQAPYNGDSPYIEIVDATQTWHAGHVGDVVTLSVSSWTDSKIVVSGFTGASILASGDTVAWKGTVSGAFSATGMTLTSGDTVAIDVRNAQTNAGPTTSIEKVTTGS